MKVFFCLLRVTTILITLMSILLIGIYYTGISVNLLNILTVTLYITTAIQVVRDTSNLIGQKNTLLITIGLRRWHTS